MIDASDQYKVSEEVLSGFGTTLGATESQATNTSEKGKRSSRTNSVNNKSSTRAKMKKNKRKQFALRASKLKKNVKLVKAPIGQASKKA